MVWNFYELFVDTSYLKVGMLVQMLEGRARKDANRKISLLNNQIKGTVYDKSPDPEPHKSHELEFQPS